MSAPSKRQGLLLSFALSVVFLGAYLFIKDRELIGDENGFYKMIKTLFDSGLSPAILFNPDTYGNSAMIPTYIVWLAGLAKVTGLSSVQAIRFFCLIPSVLSALVFYRIQKSWDGKNAAARTLQYVFLPVLFPLFFFIYTDAPSLLFILLTLYFGLERKHLWSGFFALISVLVRQDNIVWALFFAWVFYRDWKTVRAAAFYWLIPVLFAIFAAINHGVAFGNNRARNPDFTVHIENIYFCLFTFFWVFLPLNIYNFKKTAALLKNKKIPLALALFALVFFMFFSPDHPYNRPELNGYFRNRILRYVQSSVGMKWGFLAMACYAALSLTVTGLQKKIGKHLYVCATIFLALHWLIEPRYFIVPLVLFAAFREGLPKKMEWVSVGYTVVFSLLLLHRINHKLFFL